MFHGWYGIICKNEKEPLIIEMLNKRGKEKMLYGQDVQS